MTIVSCDVLGFRIFVIEVDFVIEIDQGIITFIFETYHATRSGCRLSHQFNPARTRALHFDHAGTTCGREQRHAMRVQLGAVAHFILTVSDPAGSATWWTSNFDLNEWDRNDARIIVGNESITMVLRAGTPDPVAFGHLAFHTTDLDALTAARDALRASGVALEDPGDEIGPVAPGSSSVGIWFHDLDGYRWELFVGAPTDA